MKLVKLVKLNNLQYNPNRDPEFYRITPEKSFRLQVLLGGTGEAHCHFDAGEGRVHSETVTRPGTFEYRFQYDTPGIRMGRLTVEANGERFEQVIRLDVMARAWVG